MDGKRILAGMIAAVMVMAAIIPLLTYNSSATGGTDLSIYRFTPKLTVTTEDPSAVEYIVWDFGDGTVLDGRWEYYIQQRNAGEQLSQELLDGIEEYQALLIENGNSLWVTSHTYAQTGIYTVTAVAINALGYTPEGGMPYDGTFSTDETGFDGGMFDEMSSDITEPSDVDFETSAFKAVAGSWDRVLYTVEVKGYPVITFDSMGGTPVAQLIVENGSEYTVATMPDAPTKQGFTFNGWFTDTDCTVPYDWTMRVEAPIMLYAGWSTVAVQEYDHVITYIDGTETLGIQNVRNSANDSTNGVIAFTNPVKEGYSFGGWSVNANSTAVDYVNGQQITVPLTGLTLYAVWYDDSVVSITVDGHAVNVPVGNTVSQLPKQTIEGYTFEGWYSDVAHTQRVAEDTVITAGMTFYANYTANTPAPGPSEPSGDENSQPASNDKPKVGDIEIIPAAFCAVGAVIAVAGVRYHPAILVLGVAVATVGGLDLSGVIDLF